VKNFWSGKRVLVTGFEGFIGSNLSKRILQYGAEVIGIDIRTRRKDTVFSKQDYKNLAIIEGDVADLKLVRSVIKKRKIQVIFHLAAEAIVNRSLRNPINTFSSNIQGTWNILEAARQSREIEAIICASSDKAYGSHRALPYTEKTPLVGVHPYDVSKSCADLIAQAYAHTYQVPVAITRCGNVFGPGDFNFSRIFPDAIRSAISGKKLLIRSDGKFTRDYIYVDDVVNGYMLLARRLRKQRLSGEAFNLSNESPVTVLGLLRIINKVIQKKLSFKILNLAKYEIKDQYLDSGKSRRLLGWKPEYPLEKGIALTFAWYRNYYAKRK